jgi:hypothetical protein
MNEEESEMISILFNFFVGIFNFGNGLADLSRGNSGGEVELTIGAICLTISLGLFLMEPRQ